MARAEVTVEAVIMAVEAVEEVEIAMEAVAVQAATTVAAVAAVAVATTEEVVADTTVEVEITTAEVVEEAIVTAVNGPAIVTALAIKGHLKAVVVAAIGGNESSEELQEAPRTLLASMVPKKTA